MLDDALARIVGQCLTDPELEDDPDPPADPEGESDEDTGPCEAGAAVSLKNARLGGEIWRGGRLGTPAPGSASSAACPARPWSRSDVLRDPPRPSRGTESPHGRCQLRTLRLGEEG